MVFKPHWTLWCWAQLLILGCRKLGLGGICVCLPSVTPLLKLVFSSLLTAGVVWQWFCTDTGRSHLSWIFGSMKFCMAYQYSGLFTLNYTRKGKKIWQKFWAKQESGLTITWLTWDPPVHTSDDHGLIFCLKCQGKTYPT